MIVQLEEFRNIRRGPCAVLGNGPSLSWYENLSIPAIGVNRSWRFRETEYHCALDPQHVDELREGRWTTRMLITTKKTASEDIPVESVVGIDNDDVPAGMMGGRWFYNCGALAVQIACWLGYSPVYLLGFDMWAHGGTSPDPARRLNPDELRHKFYVFENPGKTNYGAHLRILEEAARAVPPGVSVINCNPGSAVTGFPFGSLP